MEWPIWMSRKGVITKRVKTVQTALSRISAQPRSPAGRGTMFRSAKSFRPSEVSAKVQTDRPITHHDPGNIARGRPSQRHATPRTTKAREPGNKPRGRATSRTTADASVRAGKYVPRPAEISSAKSSPSDHAGRPIRPAPTVPTRPRPDVRPIVPTTVPTPRSTRSPFEAQTYVFKPGLTLSRL
ncbi:unnamed protein product [Microthlaspi erraticum]|uniref:Uncharacterized protein n=1 Tax=Microthlaspi erraticum TaxID=1685480 RepID=A0A6D2KJG0_9BRAS|nr:unnamed protein product [Microthlaspi erraticum]